MKVYLFILLIIISCSYPDIDSIPKFENLVITEKESIELCKLSNNNNTDLINCLVKYYESQE